MRAEVPGFHISTASLRFADPLDQLSYEWRPRLVVEQPPTPVMTALDPAALRGGAR